MRNVVIAMVISLTTGLSLAACGGGGNQDGNPQAVAHCRAALIKADRVIGAAILSGASVPAFRTPAACDGLSDAKVARLHAQVMSNGD